MVAVSTTGWWVIGYAVGAVVIVVAAAMLLVVIALARRIVRQAHEIEAALVGSVRHTESLFDVAMMNHALESVTRGIKRAKGEQGIEDERGLLARLLDRVLPSGQS